LLLLPSTFLLLLPPALPFWAMTAANRCRGCKHSGPAIKKTSSHHQQQGRKTMNSHHHQHRGTTMNSHHQQQAWVPGGRASRCRAMLPKHHSTTTNNNKANSRCSQLHSNLLQVHCAIS
jgi:hypothetical protein